jgi:hypothetical protein
LCNLPALPSPKRFFNERTFNSKCHRVFFKRGHVLKKRGRVLKKDGHVLKKDGDPSWRMVLSRKDVVHVNA